MNWNLDLFDELRRRFGLLNMSIAGLAAEHASDARLGHDEMKERLDLLSMEAYEISGMLRDRYLNPNPSAAEIAKDF